MPIPLANVDHAFLTGLAVAHLARAGGLEPVLDDEGNYTAQWTILVPGADVLAGVGLPIEVNLVVLPPDSDAPSTVHGPRSKKDPGS
jgi:hypothetical protein